MNGTLSAAYLVHEAKVLLHFGFALLDIHQQGVQVAPQKLVDRAVGDDATVDAFHHDGGGDALKEAVPHLLHHRLEERGWGSGQRGDGSLAHPTP